MGKLKGETCFLTVFLSLILTFGIAKAEILGCYQKNHGQLRIVSDHSQCLNSENPITLGDSVTEEPPPPPEPPVNNTRFYGIYSAFMKSGECADFAVGAFGGDSEMKSAGFSTYLPADGDYSTYTFTHYKSNTYNEVEITVDGDTITFTKDVTKTDNSGRTWTDTMIFNFNEDHSTYTLSGYIGDDIPPECMGPLTGYGQRLHHLEN